MDEFHEIGAQISVKEISTLWEVQEGKKEITNKKVEHPLAHDLTGSQEIIEKVKEHVKEITQQYEDFKQEINEYSMSS